METELKNEWLRGNMYDKASEIIMNCHFYRMWVRRETDRPKGRCMAGSNGREKNHPIASPSLVPCFSIRWGRGQSIIQWKKLLGLVHLLKLGFFQLPRSSIQQWAIRTNNLLTLRPAEPFIPCLVSHIRRSIANCYYWVRPCNKGIEKGERNT